MTQPSLWRVLEPKWRTALQRIREERSRGGSAKLLILTFVGLAFWVGVFAILYRILKYFRGVEDLGPLLAGKILGIVLLAFVGILVLSNVITALSSFFLAKDLDLLVSAPVDWLRIYLAKLGETMLHSSWMVALMAVPIFAAYGVSYRGGLLFMPYAVLTVLPLLVLPAVAGSALTLILVNIFPARRTRDLDPAGAAGVPRGVPQLARLHRGAPHSDVAVPAERMGDPGDHELPARAARPAARRAPLDHGGGLRRARRDAPPQPVCVGVHESAGGG